MPSRTGDFASRTDIKITCVLILAALWVEFATTLPATYQVKLNDFPAYHGAATMIANGQPERLYGDDFKWFTNLPVVALFLRPLAALPYEQAWKLFWWLQVTSFGATFAVLLAGLHRFYGPLRWVHALVAGGIFLSFAPILRRCLELGQTTPMMVLVFALLSLAARAGFERFAGSLLGFICLVKIPPNLLIVLLALRRRVQIVWPALAVVAAGVALSLALFGSELVGQFLDRVVWDNFGRSEAAFNNQSLEGAFMRIFTERGLADWETIPRPLGVTLAVIASAVALGALLFVRAPGLLLPGIRPDDRNPSASSLELEIALGVALMLLFFPVVWIHYYLFLAVPLCLLPAWWLARDLPRPGWLVALLVLGLFLASGFESHDNAHYAAREGELLFRIAQNRQPLGALLLVIGLSFPLSEIARRSRSS
ncbi:MAG: DUF2029 domain-containing protein [bacterium]|nr:DUF2029 domain-containing protein [bacterium]